MRKNDNFWFFEFKLFFLVTFEGHKKAIDLLNSTNKCTLDTKTNKK